MFKSIQILFYTILLVTFVKQMLTEDVEDDDDGDDSFRFYLKDIVETLEPYAANCEPQPETSHIEELILNEENPQYITKCLRYCLMKQFGVLTEDGSELNSEKFVDMMSTMHPGKREELSDMVAHCREEADETDLCEKVHTGAMCLLHIMEANGYEMPVVEQ